MTRRYKSKLARCKTCTNTLIKLIGVHTALFFIYYTLYLSNQQAYMDYYYPQPTPSDFVHVEPPSNDINDQNINENTDDMSCDTDTHISKDNNNEYLSTNSKYNVDLHNDPKKYLLLSSLFKTLDNTEICKFFASKQKSNINALNYKHKLTHSNIYCFIYNDGGYSYNFIDKILSNIFEVSYQIIDINDINNNKLCLNIGWTDKIILLLRN
eukprot:61670_1